MAIDARPSPGADRDRRRERFFAVFTVVWVAIYLVGGAIAAATGHAATARIGLAVGGFFGLLSLAAYLRRRHVAQAAVRRSVPRSW
jgi:hypothetical protein